MKLLDKRHTKRYIDESLIGKYAYIKQTNGDMDIHRIFKIANIVHESPLEYEVDNQYYFTIPYNSGCKCFCYNSTNNVKLANNDVLYIMDAEEYVDTFRTFMNNDAKYVDQIPAKIIQDKGKP